MVDTPIYYKNKRNTLESLIKFFEHGKAVLSPLEIFLEISNVCDLKCAMCPTFSELNAARFYNLKQTDRGFIDIDSGLEPVKEILQNPSEVVHQCLYGLTRDLVHVDCRI